MLAFPKFIIICFIMLLLLIATYLIIFLIQLGLTQHLKIGGVQVISHHSMSWGIQVISHHSMSWGIQVIQHHSMSWGVQVIQHHLMSWGVEEFLNSLFESKIIRTFTHYIIVLILLTNISYFIDCFLLHLETKKFFGIDHKLTGAVHIEGYTCL